MDVIKEVGKRVVFVLDRNDIESAVRHFICSCHPEFAVGYTINVSVPRKDDKNRELVIVGDTEQKYNVSTL